ncbi:M48 family metallopeptidase [Bacillus sp. FJAT-49736]|uniref:M48 family metallopeptidase n=1 Tax=Bacillus sp. FJAT-49736 TaxID=2833582 RepID=UPI001BC9BBF7|nr:M48 family metallopeptidase [Bacillus sp. FJAT-49736]MBS4171985.1 M48 family metallopeptidase [Bacillus sp. FJAT-49736]
MLRKWAFRAVIAYLLFGLAIYMYLFYIANSAIPDGLKGTSADPSTFLNGRELMLSQEYSKIKNLLFFISTPYEWLFYFLVLIFGVSRGFERWAKNTSRFHIIQSAVYLFWLSLLSFIATFPLSYISYQFSKIYHISTQTFSSWMKDEVIDFWVNIAIMFIIVTVLYALMRKFKKRWWLPAWLLSVPFTIFLMFIQPVVIDPLYNDFYPLKDKALETKILALADKAQIPAQHVYEVNMSEKTSALNAYVAGIGSNARIVLWDTTLNKLNDKEILFIMAHEMGHYVEKHIYFGIAGYLLLSLVGLWLTSILMNKIVSRKGEQLKINSVSSLSSLPLFLLIVSILLFAVSPLTNWASRYEEMRADRYGIEMTHNQKAAVQAFQDLTKSGLSEVNPPLIVKIFRYDHPTMLERIQMIENFQFTKSKP